MKTEERSTPLQYKTIATWSDYLPSLRAARNKTEEL